MDVYVKTKHLFEEASTKYTYTWNFGGDNLGKLLNFHERIKRTLKSSEIKFDSGILAKIPHRMQIAICKNGEVCVQICIKKGASTTPTPSDRYSDCSTGSINMTCALNSSQQNSIVFQSLRDDAARSMIIAKEQKGILEKEDFIVRSDETELFFHSSHMLFANQNSGTSNVSRLLTRINAHTYINLWKNKITEFQFKLNISHLRYNKDHLLEETKKVSGCVSSKRQRLDLKVNNTIQTDALFLSTKFSDFVFQSEGKDFPVHKLVIQTKSDVLARMLQEPYKEKTEGRLVLKEDPEIVEEFLRFLYTGKVNKMEENAYDLYLMADKYNVNDLKLLSEDALVTALANDNFIKIFNLGKLMNSRTLISACHEYFARNSKELCKTPDAIKEFSQECPDLLISFFQNHQK